MSTRFGGTIKGRLASTMSPRVACAAALLLASHAQLSWGFLPVPTFGPAATLQGAAHGPVGVRTGRGATCMSASWALIFDCDGVILESESLHRDAYNKVFEEFDISYRWTPEYYDELQNMIGGGIPKMRYYFGENGWPTSKLGAPPTTDAAKEAMLNTVQDRKNEIYKEMISGGVAQVRPGVLRLIDEAVALGDAKLAICSASTKTSCLFVLDNLLGPNVLKHFDLILAGDDVKKRKPHPEIYQMASSKLGLPTDRCIVVEDSLIGLQAATDAAMACVITHTPSTATQDFSAARAVFSELGDGDKVQVTAKDLRQILLATPASK